LAGSIFNRGKNVLFFEESIVCQNFFVRSSRHEQVEDVRNANAKAANTRTSTALALFNRDPLQPLDVHCNRVYALSRRMAIRWHPSAAWQELPARKGAQGRNITAQCESPGLGEPSHPTLSRLRERRPGKALSAAITARDGRKPSALPERRTKGVTLPAPRPTMTWAA
jgi:hypothetical protein